MRSITVWLLPAFDLLHTQMVAARVAAVVVVVVVDDDVRIADMVASVVGVELVVIAEGPVAVVAVLTIAVGPVAVVGVLAIAAGLTVIVCRLRYWQVEFHLDCSVDPVVAVVVRLR